MSKIYPVITLYQPWGTWIMRGWKTIETRTHDRFKGLLHKEILIHAGAKTDDSDYVVKNPYLSPLEIEWNSEEVTNGVLLGKVFCDAVCWLKDYHSKEALIDCNSTQRFGLFLKVIEKFEQPIPCKGEMGIWYYDLESMQKVRKPKKVAGPTIF